MINPGDELTVNDGRKVIAEKHPDQGLPICEGNCDLFLDIPNCASVPCNRASNAYGAHFVYKFKVFTGTELQFTEPCSPTNT